MPDSQSDFDARFGLQLPRRSRWRWPGYVLLGLLALVLLYGIARVVDVARGSFYTGDRPPYLQLPAADAMTLRWQTRRAETGVVRYGREAGRLDRQQTEAAPAEAHEVRLTGLQPDTRYYYAVGSELRSHYAGPDYWFRTPPPAGAPVPVRFLVLGDPGYPNPRQIAVRDAALAWLAEHARPNRPQLDFLLTTGDNAYTSGSNEQFQTGFFEPYAPLLRNVPVWPAYGNHDARRRAFFKLFSLPAGGESGGLPSGTEHYYAFDHGPLHVVMLDTQTSDIEPGSPMLDWLQRDLAATTQPWRVVVFHHPPYTHGSHDSDDPGDSDGRMLRIRQYLLPRLDAAGVDLVLSGHSHMYERSRLLACEYGDSTSLAGGRSADTGTGTPAGIYRKQPGRTPGAIYVVLGSSSKVDDGPLDHPAMAVARKQMGSLVVDIAGDTLSGRFINELGEVADRFVLQKTLAVARTPPCAQAVKQGD